MAVQAKDLMLRNVPVHTIRALKRAAVELDQPMGQVMAGLVERFLGLYVALHRSTDELSPDEEAEVLKAREEIARGRFADWRAVKRSLGVD